MISRVYNIDHVEKLAKRLLNRHDSDIDCSISLRFGTEFEHLTCDVLQTFKVKESIVKVTA